MARINALTPIRLYSRSSAEILLTGKRAHASIPDTPRYTYTRVRDRLQRRIDRCQRAASRFSLIQAAGFSSRGEFDIILLNTPGDPPRECRSGNSVWAGVAARPIRAAKIRMLCRLHSQRTHIHGVASVKCESLARELPF